MNPTEIRFPITGLGGACARTLERALRDIAGVTGARINPASALATVAYDPARVTLDALGDAIRRTGCGVARRERATLRVRIAVEAERRPVDPE